MQSQPSQSDQAPPVPHEAPLPESEHATIAAALLAQAARRGGRPAFTVVDPGERSTTLTYGELVERALRVAVGLRERGLRQGDRLIVCLPTCPELLVTIYGTLLAGGVCVPVYPPQPSQGLKRWKDQVLAVGRTTQARGAVVQPEARLHMASVLEQVAEDLFTAVPAQLEAPAPAMPAAVLPGDLAFVQFTSGTTSRPRGVAVTHEALMANMTGLLSVMPLSEHDTSVSWLPPYHDMGLVGHIFVPVLAGVHQVLMRPTELTRRPERWLQLVTASRATQTTAPNFAYAICSRRISRAERARIDLGSLRWALCGAEAVQAETMEAFCESFGPQGFRREALRPVYGLAEATLTATFSPQGGPRVDWVDRERLAASGVAAPVAPGQPDGQPIVSVGRPLPGHALEVIGPDGRPRRTREVGELRFRGPSVMRGYFNDPAATQAALQDGWLLTGDLGYLDEEGLLHVTGRRKDLIIKHGRNYLPDDFEAACHELPALRPGRVVAFGLSSPATGTEDLVIVAEVRQAARTHDPVLLQRIARAVTERTGVRPDRVELAEPGMLPKTTSGKLQRSRVKAAYEAGVPLRAPSRSPVGTAVEAVRSAVDLASVKISRMLGWQ